jgi:hypothetical protein
VVFFYGSLIYSYKESFEKGENDKTSIKQG